MRRKNGLTGADCMYDVIRCAPRELNEAIHRAYRVVRPKSISHVAIVIGGAVVHKAPCRHKKEA